MTTTTNLETPINGTNNCNDLDEVINGIENGVCTVACLASTSSVDAAGDYRITRRLECVWASSAMTGKETIIDLEVSGTKGCTPVVTLNGQVLPTSSVILTGNNVIEVRNLKGMLIDRVQLPVNPNATGSTAGAGCFPAGNMPFNTVAPTPTMFGYGNAAGMGRPILGIAVRPVSSELVHHVAIDARNACLISDIIPGSPAFEAGIEPNDVILAVNGKQANLSNLRHELEAATIGKTLRLVVLGKGLKRELDVVLNGNNPFGDNRTSSPYGLPFGKSVSNFGYGYGHGLASEFDAGLGYAGNRFAGLGTPGCPSFKGGSLL